MKYFTSYENLFQDNLQNIWGNPKIVFKIIWSRWDWEIIMIKEWHKFWTFWRSVLMTSARYRSPTMVQIWKNIYNQINLASIGIKTHTMPFSNKHGSLNSKINIRNIDLEKREVVTFLGLEIHKKSNENSKIYPGIIMFPRMHS